LAPPTSTQQLLAYQRLFEDGICQLEPNVYSKTFKFSDINYQTAKHDEQEDIFARYAAALNYADPQVKLQITIINRRLDHDLLKKDLFLPHASDSLNPYRDEVNQMLAEKVQQGQNNIVREKYLTFTTTAPTYQASIPALARLETDLTNHFKNLGCQTQSLSGLERLELLHAQLRPEEKFTFTYDSLLTSSLTTKSALAPDSFDFTPKDSFTFGPHFGQVLYLKDLPADLTDRFITELSDLPFDLTITLHISGVEQDKAFSLVKQKISFMEQQKIDEIKKAQKTGYDTEMIPYELKYSLSQAQKLLDDLQNKNQRMFKVTLIVFTYASTPEILQDHIYQIIATARSKANCKMGKLDYLQANGLNSSLPLGKNHLELERTLTTASTAIFIPFTTQELFQTGGMYYGLNALSHNLILFDRKTLKAPNGVILGTPGSGKSFAAKREMVNVLLNDPNSEVLIIDPEREYTSLAQGLGGEIVHISAGSKAYINPLDITMDYADDDNPILLKSEFILSLCELLIGGKSGLTATQKTVIDRSCKLTYQSYFAQKNPPLPPTLKDFYHLLKKQPEKEAAGIALALELYIKGTLSVFSHHTNVDTQNRFVVYDIRDLGKQLRTFGMLIVLDQIWNRITTNRTLGKRTWIYIDEIQLLFQNEYSANYFFELWSRARKWGAIPTGITQNVETLLLSDLARRMLSNSDFIMLLNQAASDRQKLAELLNISDKQLSFVTNTNAGQGLLFAGSSIIPFIDDFPKTTQLYRLMTTKIEEVASTPQIKIETLDPAN
jgi:type IV secretory pathway VirB4 component